MSSTRSSSRTESPQVFSPGTSLRRYDVDQLLADTNYYERRGLDRDEYFMALDQIQPNRAPIAHIFREYDYNPLAMRTRWGDDPDTGEPGYLINPKTDELWVDKVDRLSDAVYPVVDVEMYKFMDAIIGELVKMLNEEGVKTANPVHVLKATMKAGYFPVIEDYLDYYSVYQGYDFDLETAKLEL